MKCTKLRRLDSNWSEFSCGRYKVQLKHFDNPSQYGIKRGKISKLWIQDTVNPQSSGIISYDRGWDKRVTKKTPAEVKKIYNYTIKKYN